MILRQFAVCGLSGLLAYGSPDGSTVVLARCLCHKSGVLLRRIKFGSFVIPWDGLNKPLKLWHVASATPNLGYFPSCRASLPHDRYQIKGPIHCLVTRAHVCKQLPQGCYLKAEQSRLEPTTIWVTSPTFLPSHHQPGHINDPWLVAEGSGLIWGSSRAPCSAIQGNAVAQITRQCSKFSDVFLNSVSSEGHRKLAQMRPVATHVGRSVSVCGTPASPTKRLNRSRWDAVWGTVLWVSLRNHLLVGVHIGAIWQIQLNDMCAAAIRPYAKLLSPFVHLFLWPAVTRSLFKCFRRLCWTTLAIFDGIGRGQSDRHVWMEKSNDAVCVCDAACEQQGALVDVVRARDSRVV